MSNEFSTFRSGSSECKGIRVDRVLIVSTEHMPDLNADLSPWHWGRDDFDGLIWIWCYEEDPGIEGKPIPEWLLDLCITARDEYGCNWVSLRSDGDVIPNLPTYQND